MSYAAPPPPADWYPDPHGGAYLRWWNGIAWTEQTKPHAATPSEALPFAERDTLPLNPTLPTIPYATYPGSGLVPASPYGAVSPYAPQGTVSGRSPYGPVAPYGVVALEGDLPIGAWRSPVDDRPYIRGMGDAVRVAFQKYATFGGRATRSEFWYWYLFVTIVLVGSMLLSWVPVLGAVLALGLFLFALATVIPTYAVVVRRLRDAGFHWAFLFLALVPFGGIALLVMWCQPSKHP